MTLREAWTQVVTAGDYETHMAHIGQAQANALLVRDLFTADPPPVGARVLLAGAGTGQMFDFVSPAIFAPYSVTCTDVNPSFLDRLRQRFACATAIDDIEDSRLTPGFGAAIVVLVLEHVDWPKAVESLARLRPERVLIVTQRNLAGMAPLLSPGRERPSSISVFAGEAPPHQVPFEELVAAWAAAGYTLHRREERPVADGKVMTGALFMKPAEDGRPQPCE